MNVFSLGLGQSTATPQIKMSVASSFESNAKQMKLRLSKLRAQAQRGLAISSLTLDGRDGLSLLRETAASPELAQKTTAAPAPLGNPNIVAADLTETLERGALYLVSYEVLDAHPQAQVFFPGTGCPFGSRTLHSNVGIHNVLVAAENEGATTLITHTEAVSFGFISCCKAEWTLDLPPGTIGEELSDTTAGRFSGAGTPVATPVNALIPGEDYLLNYEITDDQGTTGIFISGNGPFGFQSLPFTVGVHNITITCQSEAINPFLRIDGDLTFGAMSLRRRGADAGRRVDWEIGAGDLSHAGTAVVPSAEIHVAPTGSDSLGTGSALNPYRSPAHACTKVMPGDTIYLRPGVYDPFEVLSSGTAGSPITITTLPGEERQAIIRGDLEDHVVYGGAGVTPTEATRDGIRIAGKNYITIRGLSVEYIRRNGIFIVGNGQNTVSGHHVIENCFIQHTGSSAIMTCGERPDLPVPADDPFRTRNITIVGNEITLTNVVTDYNNSENNPQGQPGGVDEAITVANSVQYAYTRGNYIHDSRQYGIDYKNHVVDGEIHGNRIDKMVRYGIYIDAGETDVRRISVRDNIVTRCSTGIVLAREEDGNDSGDGLVLEDIDVYNNIFANMSRLGLHMQRHPGDNENIGYCRRIRVRFNTLYNTNTDGNYRDINIDDWASFGTNLAGEPIVADIELRGNIAWNPDGQMRMKTNVADDPRFTLLDNFNVANGENNGIDPLFADPENGDFSLQPASPAQTMINAARAAID